MPLHWSATRKALKGTLQRSHCRSKLLWSDMSQSISAQNLVQISAQDLPLQWRESGFCQSPRWFGCFCPHFAEKSWCKNGLEQRLAARCASNVVALTDPQEKNSSHCARKQSLSFSKIAAFERQGHSLNGIWTLTQPCASSWAELQQHWRRAGFRAGSGFYNSGLTSGLRVK